MDASQAIDPLARLRETFAPGLGERLERLAQALEALEADVGDEEALHTAFREAHSIKGSAAVVELTAVSGLAHVLEELMSRWRSGALRPSAAQVAWAQ